MADWSLAIDFGTSFTTAVTSTGGGAAQLLEIDNSRYLPSVVCLNDDGQFVTGRKAASLAAVFPERAERLPKRALVATDTVRLGGQDIPTVDLVAAVLARVANEAVRQRGGDAPSALLLTHPAAWGARDLERLAAAARVAKLPAPRFLPEPVAAAIYYTAGPTDADTAVPLDGHAAVYDLGGGTFDTAVLLRTAEGYEVCGTPGGDPHFGGEDIDLLLLDLVATHLPPAARDRWDELWASSDRQALRAQAKIRQAVVEAKHTLSEQPTDTLYLDEYLDGVDDGIRVTRGELDAAITRPLTATADELLRTVATAGLAPDMIAAAYLTGGASRTPAVADLLTSALGQLPITTGDPKSVVALGALIPVAPASHRRSAARASPGTVPAVVVPRPWKVKIDDPYAHLKTPTVGGNLVYVGTASKVFAFDARSGELVWSRPGNAASRQGILAGDRIVWAGRDVFALHRETGEQLWATALGKNEVNGVAVDESRVFVATRRNILAFDLAGGRLLWAVSAHVKNASSLLRTGNILCTMDEADGVYAFDPESGRLLWHTPTKSGFWSEVATDGNLLFACAGKSVVALTPHTGQPVWSTQLKGKTAVGEIGVSPDGYLYASDRKHLHRIRAADGTIIASRDIGGQNRTRPCITADCVIIALDDHNEDPRLEALSLDLGRSMWKRSGLGGIFASPVHGHGHVYICADGGYLHAISTVDGKGGKKSG